MHAQQRVALDAGHLALRSPIGRGALPPADEVRQRIVDHGDFSAGRARVQE
jgi:hypothetical protein